MSSKISDCARQIMMAIIASCCVVLPFQQGYTQGSPKPDDHAQTKTPQHAPPAVEFVGGFDNDGNFIVHSLVPTTWTKEVVEEKIVDGKPQTVIKQVSFFRFVRQSASFSLDSLHVFDTDGNRLEREAIRDFIPKESLALISNMGPPAAISTPDGQARLVMPVDAAYLTIVKPNTPIIVKSALSKPVTPLESIAEQSPDDAHFPPTPPPAIVWSGGLDEHNVLTILKAVCEMKMETQQETVEKDGKLETQIKEVPVLISRLVPEKINFWKLMVFSIKDGKLGDQLSAADARKLLSAAQPVLFANDGTPDDRYLSIFNDGTPILVIPLVVPPSSPAPPAKTRE